MLLKKYVHNVHDVPDVLQCEPTLTLVLIITQKQALNTILYNVDIMDNTTYRNLRKYVNSYQIMKLLNHRNTYYR